MICEQWDVLVVPFPFSDLPGTKRRPALTLSRRTFNAHGHTVLAMITSKAAPAWPGDTPIEGLAEAGLRVGCLVRPKLFTLDNRLILGRIGRLAPPDHLRVRRALARHVGLAPASPRR